MFNHQRFIQRPTNDEVLAKTQIIFKVRMSSTQATREVEIHLKVNVLFPAFSFVRLVLCKALQSTSRVR